MKKLVVLLVTRMVCLAGKAGQSLVQDCLARKKRTEQAAAIATEKLKPGWTAQKVRSALGEPDKIVSDKGGMNLTSGSITYSRIVRPNWACLLP